jgi:hypothetical protein
LSDHEEVLLSGHVAIVVALSARAKDVDGFVANAVSVIFAIARDGTD